MPKRYARKRYDQADHMKHREDFSFWDNRGTVHNLKEHRVQFDVWLHDRTARRRLMREEGVINAW